MNDDEETSKNIDIEIRYKSDESTSNQDEEKVEEIEVQNDKEDALEIAPKTLRYV